MKRDDHKWDNKHPTAQMLGRWQPWHAGHQKLFEETLKKTKTNNRLNKLILHLCVTKQLMKREFEYQPMNKKRSK